MSKESLTPYSELDATLIGHAEVLKEVLRENFTGFYLTGSLAIGDFDLTSDIDFIVVTDRQLSDTEVKEVQKAHINTCNQDTRWVKHLEYSFFPKRCCLRIRHDIRKKVRILRKTEIFGTSTMGVRQSKNPDMTTP
jgi:predicted nucleotidyltransferase